MSLVRTIAEADAAGPLAELYRRLADSRGRVANILKVQSLSPETLEAHYRLYRVLMFGAGPLSRTQRELLAVVVSTENACHY
jgi:alkylhydroperoxidase family enzyme